MQLMLQPQQADLRNKHLVAHLQVHIVMLAHKLDYCVWTSLAASALAMSLEVEGLVVEERLSFLEHESSELSLDVANLPFDEVAADAPK